LFNHAHLLRWSRLRKNHPDGGAMCMMTDFGLKILDCLRKPIAYGAFNMKLFDITAMFGLTQ
jgi:hypothetical protein